MNRRLTNFVGFCGLALATILAVPADAKTPQVKEKTPLYSCASFWTIPRAQWPEIAKADAADRPTLDEALANGTNAGFGNDRSVLHQPDGDTHADWWLATSMTGLLKCCRRAICSRISARTATTWRGPVPRANSASSTTEFAPLASMQIQNSVQG